jgi:cytochrome c peroxidase
MYVFQTWYRSGVTLLVALTLGGWLTPLPLAAHQPSPPLGYEPPVPGTYELPVVKPATDGKVLDTAGATHRLFEYMHDKIVLLSFVYTRCSDARGCPLASGVLHAVQTALQRDAVLARQVRLLTLSFDPAHDTPEVMRHYAEAFGAHATSQLWYHLTTASLQALQPILDGYGQYIVPVLDAQGHATGTYAHLLKVFLIDRQQRVRNIYSVDFLHPQVLINDIKTLLMANDGRRSE